MFSCIAIRQAAPLNVTQVWGLSDVDAKAAIRHALFFDSLDGDMDLHFTVLTEGQGGNLLFENTGTGFVDVSSVCLWLLGRVRMVDGSI